MPSPRAALGAREKIWKPRTLAVNQSFLRKQILPCFAGRRIAKITRQDIARWFAPLSATQVTADQSRLPNFPCSGIARKEAS